MTNTALFRQAVERTGIKYKHLAATLGISSYGLSLKINNKNEFKASEISLLSEELGLSIKEKDSIFFAKVGDCKSLPETQQADQTRC